MKKFFFSLVVATMAATGTVFAQSSLLATLSHEGNISAYYGADALKTAMAEAEAGDIITLSSGQFNAVDINKPITLRGAGMSNGTDSLNSHEPTIVQNAFTIVIADSLSSRLLVEGIYFKNGITYGGTIKNAQFMKCRFDNFKADTGARIVNSSFIHCRIYRGFTMRNTSSNAYFINSLVCGPQNYVSSGTNTSNIEFDNCFVKFDYNTSNGEKINEVQNAYYKNCIIQALSNVGGQLYYTIPSSCIAYNCVGIHNREKVDIFGWMPSNITTNKMAGLSIFKNYSISDNGYFPTS